MEPKVVYVVVEDDRGCGPHVVGVFINKADAEKACCSSHMWISEEQLQ